MIKKRFFLLPLVIAIAISMGFVGGYVLNFKSGAAENEMSVDKLINSLSPAGVKYSTIFSLIESSYVESVNVDSIAESMLPTLLGKLDPHSSYIPKQDAQLSSANLEGQFDGIGVMFNMLTDTIVIQTVIAGGPSSKVGLEAGDRIITIDSKQAAGQKLNQDTVLTWLRGVGGTKVTLGVERSGLDSLIDIVVTRGKVKVNSIDASFMITPTTGYVKLLRFARTTHEEFLESLKSLSSQGMDNLILDLTDNRGGYLDQAILMANEFLPAGRLIVSTIGRDSVVYNEARADGHGNFIGHEVLVLIDEGSASSSEIVAGALQDNDLGTIIGRRSYGKGLVQQQVPLRDGSFVNLTIARYHTPSGRCIQRPYTGSLEEYSMDYYNRIIGGELTSRDSIHLDSTQCYTTVMGKKVYGGGGIMPDVYVPIDTLKYNDAERKLLISLVLVRYTNNYIDKHRKELQQITTEDELEKYLNSHADALYEGYIKYVNEQKANISVAEALKARTKVLNVLKAYIARQSYAGDNAFYRYILQDEDITQEALRLIRNKKEQ